MYVLLQHRMSTSAARKTHGSAHMQYIMQVEWVSPFFRPHVQLERLVRSGTATESETSNEAASSCDMANAHMTTLQIHDRAHNAAANAYLTDKTCDR
jgi:hypothetical protein